MENKSKTTKFENVGQLGDYVKEGRFSDLIGNIRSLKIKMDDLCKYLIKVPSSDTPKIQESQIMLGHIICALVEEKLLEYSSFSQLESVEKSK